MTVDSFYTVLFCCEIFKNTGEREREVTHSYKYCKTKEIDIKEYYYQYTRQNGKPQSFKTSASAGR